MSRIDQLAGVAAEMSQPQAGAPVADKPAAAPESGRPKRAAAEKPRSTAPEKVPRKAAPRKAAAAHHAKEEPDGKKSRGRPRKYPLPPNWQSLPRAKSYAPPQQPSPGMLALEATAHLAYQQRQPVPAWLPSAGVPAEAAPVPVADSAQQEQPAQWPQALSLTLGNGVPGLPHAAPELAPTEVYVPPQELLPETLQLPTSQASEQQLLLPSSAAAPAAVGMAVEASLALCTPAESTQPVSLPAVLAQLADGASPSEPFAAHPSRLGRLLPAPTSAEQVQAMIDLQLSEQLPPGAVVKPYPGSPALAPRRRKDQCKSLNELAQLMPTVECEYRVSPAPAAAAVPVLAAAEQPAPGAGEQQPLLDDITAAAPPSPRW